MKLLDRTMVNLGSGTRQDLLGHISLYETTSGNHYYVYFIETRYFGMKEVDLKTNNLYRILWNSITISIKLDTITQSDVSDITERRFLNYQK